MKTVVAYAHTHWDREWYRSFEEFRFRLVEVVDRVVSELDKGQLKSFYFDGQTGAIEDYLEIHPEQSAKIKELIKQKKLFIGPFYCLSDVFLVNASSLSRNLELGLDKARELGCNDFIAYLADTFGHSKGIIPILNYFNIDKVVMWRGLPDTPSEFLWQNLKAINLQRGYFNNILSLKEIDIEKKAKMLEDELVKIAQNSKDTILFPIGGDHLACPFNLEEQILELNKYLKNFKIQLGSPFDYFEKVKNNHDKIYNCEFLDNSKTFLLKGVYSSRIYLKQENARLQWLLGRIAEPLQAIAYSMGYSKNYQNECNYAYKTLLKNHAHDGIYGCSTDMVHSEMITRFAKINDVTNSIIKSVQRDLSDGYGLSVANLSNFTYSGVVKIKSTKKIKNAQLLKVTKDFADEKIYDIDDVPITEDITNIYHYLIDVKNLAPFSITPFSKCENKEKQKLNITANSISNDKISLEIKNSEIIIKDKKNNRIYKDFLTFVDCQDVGDTYNFAPLKNDVENTAKIIKTKILQNGIFQSILQIVYEIKVGKQCKKHKIFLDVILQKQSDFIEFQMNWENKSKNHRFQLKINLPQNITKVLSEDTCGTVEREFDPKYKLVDFIPAPKGIELQTNTAPFQRFVTTQSICILTEGLHEYEVEKNSLKITLLRSIGIISNPKNPTRGTPAGPPIAVKEAQCLGNRTARFGICFTQKELECFKNAEFFFGPTIPIFANIEKEFFNDFKSEKKLIHSVKITPNGLSAQAIDLNDSCKIIV